MALHLRRAPAEPDNFSVELLRVVIKKARELNYSLRDLDEEVSMKGYFSSYEPSEWVRADAVIKAINAMGGELRIHLYGEARVCLSGLNRANGGELAVLRLLLSRDRSATRRPEFRPTSLRPLAP